jgi:hypothetical protein
MSSSELLDIKKTCSSSSYLEHFHEVQQESPLKFSLCFVCDSWRVHPVWCSAVKREFKVHPCRSAGHGARIITVKVGVPATHPTACIKSTTPASYPRIPYISQNTYSQKPWTEGGQIAHLQPGITDQNARSQILHLLIAAFPSTWRNTFR